MVIEPPPLRCDVVIGTRPEAIKLAPVIRALRSQPREFCVRVVTSGQHGEICSSALAAFGIAADCALDIEPVGCSLADSASDLVRAFGRHITESHPDLDKTLSGLTYTQNPGAPSPAVVTASPETG